MPLHNLHQLLTRAAVKHLNCPYCGGDMETAKKPLQRSRWRKLLRLPPRMRRHQLCTACGWHYGLVQE